MLEKSFKTINNILVTERAYSLASETNTYVFDVSLEATKDEIRNAVKDIYDVKPLRVRTSILRGKTKRTKKGLTKRPNVKKAFVTLATGDTLPVYEEI